MPLPKRNPGQEAARRMIRHAFEDLEQAISPTDCKDLKDATLESIQKAALDIEDQLAMRSSLRNMRRLQPLFDGLAHYSKSIEVLCNGTPYLPWLWAPIKLVLKISSDFIEAFEKIIKGYAQIGESLKRFAILRDTFRDNPPFQQTLAIFYTDILGFHKQAYIFVRRNCWRLLFLSSWGRFQRRFDRIIEDLKSHGELIDKEASAIHIAEARESRQRLEAWRQDSLAKLGKDEEEETANQLQTISTWLKTEESDQTAILDKTAAEGSKYPGTCSWILNNSSVASWLRSSSETPFLWLHGNPGTGKSVIASQIVGFLKASHNSLVVTHFCTYSYASSIEYEKILKSLVLQLVRANNDLISHIYWEYVISKKVASIPALEQLLLTAAMTILSEPGRSHTVHILVDGLDEIEPEKQRQLIKLMSKITNSTRSCCITFKVLITCRTSPLLEKLLQRKSNISLGEEKEVIQNAIWTYASQRLKAKSPWLTQLGINDGDIGDFARIIARKADGMFLWARLVLDYLSTNIFHDYGEFKEAINTLPRKLSEFYERILVTIISKFDSRSIERFSRILGWIAFAKRPLTKAELRSAISFAPGNPEIENVMPLYIFDMCSPLIEERRDTTLCFIHVSVKDYLESSESKLPLSESRNTQDHLLSCITCLLSGLRVFRPEHPEKDRHLRVLKGIHSFHIYANEYWVDYVFSVAKYESLLCNPILLSVLGCISQELESLQIETFILNVGNLSTPAGALEALDEFKGLHCAARKVLDSRSQKNLGAMVSNRGLSEGLKPAKGFTEVLANYQHTVQSLLAVSQIPEVSQEELDHFKREHHQSAFTCRWPSCPRVTLGFETEKLQLEHEATHAPTINCSSPGCQYPPFPSLRALKNHETKCHSTSPRRKQVRRTHAVHDQEVSIRIEAPALFDSPMAQTSRPPRQPLQSGELPQFKHPDYPAYPFEFSWMKSSYNPTVEGKDVIHDGFEDYGEIVYTAAMRNPDAGMKGLPAVVGTPGSARLRCHLCREPKSFDDDGVRKQHYLDEHNIPSRFRIRRNPRNHMLTSVSPKFPIEQCDECSFEENYLFEWDALRHLVERHGLISGTILYTQVPLPGSVEKDVVENWVQYVRTSLTPPPYITWSRSGQSDLSEDLGSGATDELVSEISKHQRETTSQARPSYFSGTF